MNSDNAALISLLDYYKAIGINTLISESPINHLKIIKKKEAVIAETPTARRQLPYLDILQKKLAAIENLEGLQNFLETLEDCSIKRTAMHLIMGYGNPKTDIMVISDMPSEDEDRSGIPFSGPSGDLYKKMMIAISLDPIALYACHFLPWRPPGSRTPSTKEATIFALILQKHIALIDPKIILFMGGLAPKEIFKVKSSSTLRGKEKSYDCPFRSTKKQAAFISYSPAYLMQFPTYKKKAWEDLQKFKTLLP